jgi:hypothetical protein
VLYLFFYNFSVHKTFDADQAKAAADVVDRILTMEDCMRHGSRPIPVAGFAGAVINSGVAEG